MDRSASDDPEVSVPTPASKLPTLQRNALRKIFDRVEFSPEEVVELGCRRLRQAEGIGEKGMKTIVEWLAGYGYQLPPETLSPDHARRAGRRGVGLERAMRLLRIHGYEVSAPGVVQNSVQGSAPAAPLGKRRHS